MHKKTNNFVVIPAYNEERNIHKVLQNVTLQTKNVIVVDDGSSDRTSYIAKQYIKHVVRAEKNIGKGAALRIGCEYAFDKLKADSVVMMDGDNQHNTKHLKDFFELLNKTDIVIGIRILKTNIPIYRKIGNNIMAFFMQKMFSISLPDMLCGFRGLTKKGYKQVYWKSNGYGIETEMLTIIGRKKIPYQTITVDTIYHEKYKGFSVTDGTGILLKLVYWKLRKI